MFYSDIEDGYDDPDRIGRFCGLAQVLSDEETLVIGGGDSIGPSLLSTQTAGRHAVDFYERVGTDIEVFGNHEFDFGLEPLKEVIRASPQTWVTANLHEAGTEHRFAADIGVESSVTYHVGDTKIGIFGVTHGSIGDIAPNADGLTTSGPVATACRISKQLRNDGVDVVVGVAHTDRTDEIVSEADIDVLLAGHVNERLERRVDGTLIVRTIGSAKEIVEISIDGSRFSVTHHPVQAAPVDEQAVASLRSYEDERKMDASIDCTDAPIDIENRMFDSVVAEALRHESGADIGLINRDAVRDEPQLHSRMTSGEILRAIPFPQPAVVVEVSGRELLEVVDNSMSSGDESENIAYSGLTIDETSEGSTVHIDDDPVEEDGTYTIATLAFVIESNRTFGPVDENHLVETIGPQHECIVNYLTGGS
ncbi:5'-nucleotidase C-terminal domain-containing protein [Halorubrum vacuolatum]|uniref:5'-nucleotidase C-terminal domain-containing protein n=1 Tax=Halorubrum vacuolatum TaxID=63740 RepID=UPI00117A064D|nr:5'-nucleotidase C-terminal domain-containing protein [Halorubrum vacuolatum]